MDTDTTTSTDRWQVCTDLLRAIEDTLDAIDRRDYKDEPRAALKYARLNMLRAMVEAPTAVGHSGIRFARVLLDQALMIYEMARKACPTQSRADSRICKLAFDHYMATVEYFAGTTGD